ncbi:MAG: hypothetical protein KAI66_03200 [Lentisphaeria bacterium]|nr:hypothetical protein [Lentisphaeria bacterium]
MEPKLSPGLVCVTMAVENDPRSRERAERMIAAMTPGKVMRNVDDAQLDKIAADRDWKTRILWGERQNPQDPDMVFTVFPWNVSAEEKKARLQQHPNLSVNSIANGPGWLFRGDGTPEWRKKRNAVCQPAWQLHSATGCPFRCAYCWFGNVINIRVNMEDLAAFTEREIVRLDPPQTIWKWDNQTDINCFEPEYDAVRPLVESFAKQREHYLLLYTGKSDNVDFMLDYDHKGQTIIQWSLSPRTQSLKLEPLTAPWDARVESMRKCEEAGYQVRFRFSPIMPVNNWREEYTELIELIFAKTHPDVCALCMFGWMDFEQAERCLDLSLWDPIYVEAMRAAAPFLKGQRTGPIPHDARAELYQHLIDEITRVSPKTPIALCLDTPEMWRQFEDQLNQTAEEYVCVCGPYCSPGNHQFRCRETDLAFMPQEKMW